MAVEDYYNRNVPQVEIDISASQRKFQTSVIIKQDPNKDGVLSFLEGPPISQAQETATPAQSTTTQTTRPSSGTGGY